jgi:hypothetical protein
MVKFKCENDFQVGKHNEMATFQSYTLMEDWPFQMYPPYSSNNNYIIITIVYLKDYL